MISTKIISRSFLEIFLHCDLNDRLYNVHVGSCSEENYMNQGVAVLRLESVVNTETRNSRHIDGEESDYLIACMVD